MTRTASESFLLKPQRPPPKWVAARELGELLTSVHGSVLHTTVVCPPLTQSQQRRLLSCPKRERIQSHAAASSERERVRESRRAEIICGGTSGTSANANYPFRRYSPLDKNELPVVSTTQLVRQWTRVACEVMWLFFEWSTQAYKGPYCRLHRAALSTRISMWLRGGTTRRRRVADAQRREGGEEEAAARGRGQDGGHSGHIDRLRRAKSSFSKMTRHRINRIKHL